MHRFAFISLASEEVIAVSTGMQTKDASDLFWGWYLQAYGMNLEREKVLRHKAGFVSEAHKEDIMAILPKLQEYLESHHAQYEVLKHVTTYTAQETARVQHIPGKEVAKVVMVKKGDQTPVMLVLPASYRVDFETLRAVVNTGAVLEEEREFRALFPGCETGAEPPFGNLFDLETVVDTALTRDEQIVFNAGSHRESVRMRYEDFANLVHPHVATFACPYSPMYVKNPYGDY